MVNINNNKVILAPFLLFNRFSSISQRNLTVAESLAYELTMFHMNLFDSEQYMRDSHKAEFGKHVKDKVVTLTSCHTDNLFIDGGWLIHQIPWPSGKIFYLFRSIKQALGGIYL